MRVNHFRKTFRLLVALSTVITFCPQISYSNANAVGAPTPDLNFIAAQVGGIYMDAPFVQSSYLADPKSPMYDPNSKSDNFDQFTTNDNSTITSADVPLEEGSRHCPLKLNVGNLVSNEDLIHQKNTLDFGGVLGPMEILFRFTPIIF